MTDEKQIEEMAKELACSCVDLVKTSCDGKPCYVCIAEKLAKQNYRKIPENAVVLTIDELNEKENEAWDRGIEYGKEIARKETAREIFAKIFNDETLYNEVGCGSLDAWDYWQYCISIEGAKELAKQYGVEVE